MTARRLTMAAGTAAAILTLLHAGAAAGQQSSAPTNPPAPNAPASPPAANPDSAPGNAPASPTRPAGARTGGRSGGSPSAFGGGSPYTPTFDVDFRGGTLRQFVQAVQEGAAAQSHAVNVVVPEEAEQVKVPAIALKAVTAATALGALRWAFADSSEAKIAVNEFGSTADGGSSSFAVMFQQRPHSSFALTTNVFPNPTVTQVFSIRNSAAMLGGGDSSRGAERVIDAVDAALGLQEGEAAQVRYHPDSAMLIVRGRQDQVVTVSDVLARLESEAVGTENARRDREVMLDKLRMQSEQAGMELEVARTRLENARISERQTEQLAAAGSASDAQLRVSREAAQMAELDLKRTELALASVRRQLDALESDQAIRAGKRLVVVYDAADLAAFAGAVRENLVRAAGAGGSVLAVGSTGRFAVTATADGQRACVDLLNLARQIRANDPNLKGPSAEDLLKNAKQEGAPSAPAPK